MGATGISPVIAARIKATLVEGAICVLLMAPIYLLLARQALGGATALAVTVSLGFLLAPLTLVIRSVARGKAPAEEHLRAGLALRGEGCNLCRLMRFWWPLAAAPAGAAAALYWGIWGPAPLGLAMTAVHLATGLAALAEDKEPHWARATGFHFEPVERE
ncbi:MAG: hypothetical protein AAGF78_09930 [Pseudomonadota bacterium]